MGFKARPRIAGTGRAGPGGPTLDLTRAYQRGARFTSEHATYTVELVEAGAVRVVSGKLWAGDPFSITSAVPLRRRIPGGVYPVVLSVARIVYQPHRGHDQERVAQPAGAHVLQCRSQDLI